MSAHTNNKHPIERNVRKRMLLLLLLIRRRSIIQDSLRWTTLRWRLPGRWGLFTCFRWTHTQVHLLTCLLSMRKRTWAKCHSFDALFGPMSHASGRTLSGLQVAHTNSSWASKFFHTPNCSFSAKLFVFLFFFFFNSHCCLIRAVFVRKI